MNKKIKFTAALLSLMYLAMVSEGCSSTQSPVQTKAFSLANVKSILVDYDGESVTVKESDSDNIVVVEYMDKIQKSYFAKIDLSGNVLTISEGARPIGNGVHASLDIYVPDTYKDSMSLHTTDGWILSDAALALSSFQADTTNGTIEISNLMADQIDLKSTGGKLTAKDITGQICTVDTTNADTYLDSITGRIGYESKGGDLTAFGCIGYGDFLVTGDGSLDITFAEVTGNISACTKNGEITLGLPDNLEFVFSAATKNGKIQTSFAELLSVTDKTAGGTIGGNADVKIGIETKNGDINVTK